MILGKSVPRKVWLFFALAVALALWPILGPWLTGPTNPRDVFLNAVAADLAKDPRVAVVRVDHAAGRIAVHVKPTNQSLVFCLTRMEPRTQQDGQPVHVWEFQWQDEAGSVIAVGRGSGTQTNAVHVDVPGLK